MAGLRAVRLRRPEVMRPELLRYCIDRSDFNSGGGYKNVNPHKYLTGRRNSRMVRVSITGSGGDTLDGFGPLECVLVDEATRAREAAVVVPLMRGCKQSMLVGDHCQSPEGHGGAWCASLHVGYTGYVCGLLWMFQTDCFLCQNVCIQPLACSQAMCFMVVSF